MKFLRMMLRRAKTRAGYFLTHIGDRMLGTPPATMYWSLIDPRNDPEPRLIGNDKWTR